MRERQSAGRVGRPIPRHCAPQSIGVHCGWRQFDAHTPGTAQQSNSARLQRADEVARCLEESVLHIGATIR